MNTVWTAWACIAAMALLVRASAADEVLYNGIRLSSPFPPKDHKLSLDPPPLPPYLVAPPAVIPIDVGRQLFVDDFLVEHTTLTRTYHLAEFHPANPVLKPDKPWECEGRGPMAMPFSGGVFYDPRDQLFKMWYMGSYSLYLCYATSRDGIQWDKPSLDAKPGTNIVVPSGGGGANTVWLDLETKDPERRFVFITTHGGEDLIPAGVEWHGSKCSMDVHFSLDGIHWGKPVVRVGPCGDRNSAFWNPFRKVWVYSIRGAWPFGGVTYGMRCRQYWEVKDLAGGLGWKYGEAPLWVGADDLDLPRPERKIRTELYTLDAVGYESLMLSLFTIYHGWGNVPEGRPKPNELCVGFSRDGLHWHRPDRRSFIPVSERPGDWNYGNVQSAGGCCLIVGDKLHFYVSGRAGCPTFHDACGSTGLATLRRDGFASMDAGEAAATLTTRPVRFTGKYLFVNMASSPQGELVAEALDEHGRVIKPFSMTNCEPLQGDRTAHQVKWRGAADLSALSGKPVKFRFHLRNGRLYAFWVSPDASGASHGYVAAGGPGFTGPTDTVGIPSR
ncbi:MAG: glycosyl hydrolase family 32 [Planctomycetes bacterium]|nr:glycosyl hydrolase family 32 [Planctomycetota bacterium]